MVTVQNSRFVNGIMNRYTTEPGRGTAGFVYRKEKNEKMTSLNQKFVKRLMAREIYVKIKQYERKYYQYITNKDNRKFIRTVEQINSQPQEKKQLVYILQKMGVMTSGQKEWQETRQLLRTYEEELIRLKKQIQIQEESVLKLTVKEEQQPSVKVLTRQVLENIKNELRFERLRYGLD